MRCRRFVAAILLPWVLLTGCSTRWQRVDLSAARPERRERVQVWSEGQSQVWHSVRIAADSISGIPFFRDPGCDDCRISFKLAQVDSVRVGGGEATAGGVVAGFLLFAVALVIVPITICLARGGQTCIFA